MRFDIHVHTDISPCSDLKISEIIEHAGERGLHGVCITDHGTMEISRKLSEGFHQDLMLIFGIEYTTSDGDFLLFGPFEDLAPGLSAVQLLEHVNDSGGAAIAAHPFRDDRPVSEYLIKRDYCNIIEGISGRSLDTDNSDIDRWRSEYELIECGGSDAHTLYELGSVVTDFSITIRTREDIILALKNGLCRPELNVMENII